MAVRSPSVCRGVRVSSALVIFGMLSRFAIAQTNLTGQVELARLVDVAAQRLGLRVTYDEQSLKGKVTIRQEKPL